MIPGCGVSLHMDANAAQNRTEAHRLTSAQREMLVELGLTPDPPPAAALMHREGLAAALVDRRGGVVASSEALAGRLCLEGFDSEVAERVRRTGDPQTILASAPGDATGLAVYAYGLAGRSLHWALPDDIRDLARKRPYEVVVLTALATASQSPLVHACRAYGLTDLQSRVAVEAARTGSIRLAASRLQISYDTAREALAAALQRAGVTRLPALVSRLVSLAFGVFPSDDGEKVISDLWNLTPRQATIALLVADGADHVQTARALGLSAAVVKKSLKDVYQLLQVSSSAGLARKLQETLALARMMAATEADVDLTAAGAEPLRFVLRPDGSRIAVSDYGPASGRPVLVAHSSMTTRVVARRLRAALQAQGLRPISIDRPGFGLTDEVAGLRAGAHDPFQAAAEDACLVLRRLRISQVDVVARGAAQFVVALHHAAPELVGAVVLTNPDPPTHASGGAPGPIAVVKNLYRSNPTMIRVWASITATQVTYDRMSRMLKDWLRDSPPDSAVLKDEQVLQDYFRAVRTFVTGRFAGYVNEQIEFARGRVLAPVENASSWCVLVGAHDPMHDPGKVVAYWRSTLLDARVVVAPDAGRLLTFSHTDLVIDCLMGRELRSA